MAKIWIFAVLAVASFVQISYAAGEAEAANGHIRNQLQLFEKIRNASDSGPYANELKQLIELMEGALKSDSIEEKNNIISSAPSHFDNNFNKWITSKIEEDHVNRDIQDAVEFYNNLLNSQNKHAEEIKTIIGTLRNLSKESNLKQKEEKFLGLEMKFSLEFHKFLEGVAVGNIKRRLQNIIEFFDKLLNENDNKFTKEIEALKSKALAALENTVSIEDKNQALHEITFTENVELNEFLRQKTVEYSYVVPKQ